MSRARSARGISLARFARGMSLVELMVSLAIGSVLIAGAVYAYSEGRKAYTINESLARVQEQARYVLSVIEPDLELAGYYGFSNVPDSVRFVRGAAPNTVLANATTLRQYALPPVLLAPVAAPTLPGSAHSCGVNFAVDIATPVQGADDTYAFGPGAAGCDAFGAGAQAGSDTLTVRRAATTPSAAQAGRIQLYASRLTSRTSQVMFADGVAPGPLDANNRIHDLLVRAYYVSQDSVERPGLPALRVKTLTRVGGAPAFLDNEVMPGIEDLQVQFGIDSGDYDNDGNLDAAADLNGDGIAETDGRATRYVDPDFAGLERLQIVSVRVWLRVRGEQAEPGFVDNRTYRYANVEFTPAGDQQQFRRVLLSRTISLRNARTL